MTHLQDAIAELKFGDENRGYENRVVEAYLCAIAHALVALTKLLTTVIAEETASKDAHFFVSVKNLSE